MATTFPVIFINTEITDNGGPFATPWVNPENVSDDDSDATSMLKATAWPDGGQVHEFQVDNQNRGDLLYYKAEVTWEITAAAGGSVFVGFQWEHKDGGNFASFGQYASAGTTQPKIVQEISLKPFGSTIKMRVANSDVKFRFVTQPNNDGDSATFHVYRVRLFLKNRYTNIPHEG